MQRTAIPATLMLLPVSLCAQWLNYPTPGVPRLSNGKPNLAAPAPRSVDGKPDLSGLWEFGTGGSNDYLAGAGLSPEYLDIESALKAPLPYRPWARNLRKAREADHDKDEPGGKCLPMSILQDHTHPFPRKVIQVPGLVVILNEKSNDFRQIFTDGRPLPVDPQPSFKGYSSGKWDGATLVVQTIGFREDSWADVAGSPITEAAKVTERFHRPNYGSLEIEFTVEDPKAYTAPWTIKLQQHLKLDTDLLEYVCLENEKDVPHLLGK